MAQPERIWRLECQPGEELQLDFGLGAPIDDGRGQKRRRLRRALRFFGPSLPMPEYPRDRRIRATQARIPASKWIKPSWLLTLMSSYVYGRPAHLPISENDSLQAFNPYL